MSVDQVTTPDRGSIASIADALDGMLIRLREILAEPALTQETLVEIMAIYNNVAYIFLYLEATDDEVSYQSLRPRRAEFHDDPRLDARLLELLEQLHCQDSDVEDARLEYADQLRKAQRYDPTADRKISALLEAAKAVQDEVRQDQRRMLERIGVGAEIANPSVVFYRLISDTQSAVTRHKLARAWQLQRDNHLADLVGIVDEMIEVRRRDCATAGYDSVLARSLGRSRVAQGDIEPFIGRYVLQALDSHRLLAAEVRELTGEQDQPMEHFGFAMRAAFGGTPTPTFALDECLDFLFAVTRSVFGLDLRRVADLHPGIIAVDVYNGDVNVGQIKFDLWDTGRKIAANHTNGVRNRTEWPGLVQRPVAYVACRFKQTGEMGGRITFQNVHSLFHEFGHAINHLMIRKRFSFQSGLEYLPPERLECLSMWFEKWVYHPEFARHLTVAGDDQDHVARCGRMKMIEYRRTYVERAVSAALDFDVNRRGDGGLRASWDRLDAQFGLSEHCAFGDFPAYFTWPMYVAKPGANFSYLWGSADSCEKFAPFSALSLEQVAADPSMRDLFEACFDFDSPSAVPDTAAVFSLYDSASLAAKASRT